MSTVAKRFWEGSIYKDNQEIGFAEGTISIDNNFLYHYCLGSVDYKAQRSVARVIECTIDHGYISKALFFTEAINATNFTIWASMSDHAIRLSGCTIESYDFELPTDGWINESISVRAQSIA